MTKLRNYITRTSPSGFFILLHWVKNTAQVRYFLLRVRSRIYEVEDNEECKTDGGDEGECHEAEFVDDFVVAARDARRWTWK